MSKVDWEKSTWDPTTPKKAPERPPLFGRPKSEKTGYVSPLDPPPGDPRAAHPPTSRFRVVDSEE